MRFFSDHGKALAKKLAASLLGLTVALTVVEVLTRLFIPDPAYRFENQIGMFEPSSVLGYRNKPGFRGYANGRVPIEVNALGFRGAPVSLEKPARSVRVLALGDSITFGVGVPDEETYVRVLETLLNEQLAPTGRRAETINAGVVGYSFQQELLSLQHDGVGLSPDIVLVGFARNDFYPTEDPFSNVHLIQEPPLPPGTRRDYYSSELEVGPLYSYRFARGQLHRLYWQYGRDMHRQSRPLASEWREDSYEASAWPFMQGQMRTLQRLAMEHHFRLLVILFPLAAQLPADHHFPQDRIADFLHSIGIDTLDPSDALRPHWREAFQDQMHLTPIGHRLVADAIAGTLNLTH